MTGTNQHRMNVNHTTVINMPSERKRNSTYNPNSNMEKQRKVRRTSWLTALQKRREERKKEGKPAQKITTDA